MHPLPPLPLVMVALAMVAAPAGAQQGGPSLAPLFACLDRNDGATRAACLEAEAQRLRQATGRRDVVVMDKAQAVELHRMAERAPDVAEKPARAKRPAFAAFEDRITAATPGNGGWMLRTATHGDWVQADSTDLGRSPRAGDMIRVRRGAIGGYLANIADGPAVRVRPLG